MPDHRISMEYLPCLLPACARLCFLRFKSNYALNRLLKCRSPYLGFRKYFSWLAMAGSPSEYLAVELALTRQAFDLLTHARATFSFSFLFFFLLFFGRSPRTRYSSEELKPCFLELARVLVLKQKNHHRRYLPRVGSMAAATTSPPSPPPLGIRG